MPAVRIFETGGAFAAAPPLELDGHQFGLQSGAESSLTAQVILEPWMLAGSPRRLEAVTQSINFLGLAGRERRRPMLPAGVLPVARNAHSPPSAAQRLRMTANFRSTVRRPQLRARAISSLE